MGGGVRRRPRRRRAPRWPGGAGRRPRTCLPRGPGGAGRDARRPGGALHHRPRASRPAATALAGAPARRARRLHRPGDLLTTYRVAWDRLQRCRADLADWEETSGRIRAERAHLTAGIEAIDVVLPRLGPDDVDRLDPRSEV